VGFVEERGGGRLEKFLDLVSSVRWLYDREASDLEKFRCLSHKGEVGAARETSCDSLPTDTEER
jgi:hypothetical protein